MVEEKVAQMYVPVYELLRQFIVYRRERRKRFRQSIAREGVAGMLREDVGNPSLQFRKQAVLPAGNRHFACPKGGVQTRKNAAHRAEPIIRTGADFDDIAAGKPRREQQIQAILSAAVPSFQKWDDLRHGNAESAQRPHCEDVSLKGWQVCIRLDDILRSGLPCGIVDLRKGGVEAPAHEG